MRLERYLIEGDTRTIDKKTLVNAIQTKCSKWLNEVNFLVYRGMSENQPFTYKQPRTDRKSLSGYQAMFDLSDKFFKQKYGWKARSEGLMATGKPDQSEMFGNSYMIFPIGDYKYIYSPTVNDFNRIGNYIGTDKGFGWSEELNHSIGEGDEDVIERFTEFVDDNFTNKNLNNTHGRVGEIMIKCDSYIAVARVNGIIREPELREKLFK